MNIDAVHQKLADDEVLTKANAFSEIVGNALFEYTCTAESVEDCWRHLDVDGNQGAVELLKDAYECATATLDAIEDAHRDYAEAFEKIAAFAAPVPARNIFKMTVLDALFTLNGRAPVNDVTDTAKALLGDSKEELWSGTLGRAMHDMERGGLLRAEPPGVWRLTDKGWELAQQRLRERVTDVT